jgi:surface polysaccharide O-acyltransferase-like enzyme
VKTNELEKRPAISKCMTWFFLTGSVLILIYTYYRSEIEHSGLQSALYVKYYVISILGIFFWGALLWVKEEIRANILTVFISLIIGLYMVEGGFYFFNRARTAARLGIEFDGRTRFEVIESLRAEGIDAMSHVSSMKLIGQGGGIRYLI